MNDKNDKEQTASNWRFIHTVFWLIGIAVIALNDWWWPGILVLVAVSMILRALLQHRTPSPLDDEQGAWQTNDPDMILSTRKGDKHNPELLPSKCSKCGGPIREHEVRWTRSRSAECPFCEAKLPMRRF